VASLSTDSNVLPMTPKGLRSNNRGAEFQRRSTIWSIPEFGRLRVAISTCGDREGEEAGSILHLRSNEGLLITP